MTRRPWTEEEISQLGEMYKSKISAPKIGEKLNRSASSIRNAIKAFDIASKYPQPPEIVVGDKYGRLTILEDLGVFIKEGTKYPVHYVKCICDCDDHTEIIVAFGSLKDGTTQSCGCLGRERRLAATKKHGLSGTRIKRIFYNMHSRCGNPNTPKFKNHGGRGIKICDEWSGENGLVNFYNWAINNGYADDLTLDRIDNDGNYEPSNCRWTDEDVQHENRRVTRYFEINGESKMAKDWCEEYGININTFWQRALKGLTGADLIAPPSNRTSNNKSGIIGVRQRSDTGKWITILQKNNVDYRLGNYETKKEATLARLAGEIKHLGYFTDNYQMAIKLGIVTEEEIKNYVKLNIKD